MKAVLTCLLLVAACQLSYGIGRPNNLFVARQMLLKQRQALQRTQPAVGRPSLPVNWRHAYTYLPGLVRVP